MIKGIIEQAVIDILREQNLIDDPTRYTTIRDTQTRVEDISDTLKACRKELEGLRAALEICHTDDEEIEKKYRHKKWNEITKEEKNLLCKRYGMSFGLSLTEFTVFETDYIGDSLQSKKRWEEMAKQAVENSTKKAKKAKKNACRK